MEKLKKKICLWMILGLMIISVTGCANKPEGCAWVQPIYIDKSELACMTRDTKQQILTLDETWKSQQK